MYFFSYCYKIYFQIKKLYQIKTHLDIIHKSVSNNELENDKIQEENFNSLKQLIFTSGSLYIKFFQWYISKLKANIINNDTPENKQLSKFINYFQDIFENCPYHSLEHSQKIFANTTGIDLDDYIVNGSLNEIASGSIGQVYKAIRKEDKKEIAIKIKHPNIEQDLEDQKELIQLVKLVQSFKYLRNRYNLFFNLDDFLNDVNLQCDFNNEANNCNKFRENLKNSSEYVVFPEVIYQSKDILISEYIKGEDFYDLTDSQKRQITLNFVSFIYQMILVDNFVHGDLHCKNWKVRQNPNGNNHQIIIYDCGICFENTDIEMSNDFWFSLMKYDIEGVIRTLKQLIVKNDNLSDEKFNMEIKSIFDNVLKKSLSTSLVMKTILDCFRINDIIVSKFLLNISLLLCVIEDFLKTNDITDKDKTGKSNTNMYNIINDLEFDLMAFSDIKGCYKDVAELLRKQMKNKYEKYKQNVETNEIKDFQTNEKRLFSCISLSGLIMKPPE